jgi:hypothetical protein
MPTTLLDNEASNKTLRQTAVEEVWRVPRADCCVSLDCAPFGWYAPESDVTSKKTHTITLNFQAFVRELFAAR